jgi:magnesium and cobalt transporter
MNAVVALVALSAGYLLLSCVRHAALVLGPVGIRRTIEDHPSVARYFRSDYLQAWSPVRTSLVLGTQLGLAGAALAAWTVVSSRGAAARWGAALGFTAGLVVIGGGVLARGAAALWPEACLVRLLWLVGLVDLVMMPLSRPLAALSRRFRSGEGLGDAEGQEEEIEAFIDVGEQEGLLEEGEGSLIRGVLDFGDRVVREVMTPRTAMVAVSAGATVEELRDVVVSAKHSRLPAYRGSLDEIVGIVFVRDLLEILGRVPPDSSIGPLIRPAYFVPETKRVSELLRELQRRRTHLAIIVDEYGGTAGLVTIEDLIEEIVGEIQDEHEPIEEEIQVGEDGTLEVTGGADIERVAEALELGLDDEEYETVGGFVFSALGRVPRRGESFVHGGLAVEVLDADRRRVHRVRLRRAPGPPGGGAPPAGAGGGA